MSSKLYVKLLVGNCAGAVVIAQSIGAADTLEQSIRWNLPKNPDKFFSSPEGIAQIKECKECWNRNKGDGVWVEAHKRRYTLRTEAVFMGDPFDKKGREIKVGDIVIYAMRDLTVSELRVDKITFTSMDTTMHGTDLHTGKKTKNSYPKRCLLQVSDPAENMLTVDVDSV
jgi:hypothetical protein